jgi:uncharacterized protein YndB with AHSA1/START domain
MWGNNRTDSASRVIKASPETIYKAFLDREAITIWRPPKGMQCYVFEFDPQQGGKFRMSFSYISQQHDVKGKSSAQEDIFHGVFKELIPNKKIVELVQFESDDPAYAEEMTVTTTLEPIGEEDTRVTFTFINVPTGIKPEDHQKGISSTLDNLAAYAEPIAHISH